MQDREWQIGLVGTFDVENYGDLLFPLIAEAELTQRLGRVQLHRFSYHSKRPPSWPYPITSLTELPQLVSTLDAILIGGGFLIRFDKEVAPGYEPPTRSIHHPTGYWLTPALVGLQHGVPVAWNAPGMHCNEVPVWAEPLMKLVLEHSPYVAVRDQASRTALARFICSNRISVVPDTGFGVGRLVEKEPTAAFLKLRETAGLTKPYIIIQAALGLEPFLRFIKVHGRQLSKFQFLVLPISPVIGDDTASVEAGLPGCVRLSDWPSILVLAELIGRAEAVVGHSYHLAITAIAHGVPVFTPQELSVGKYSALLPFERIYPLPTECESDSDLFHSRIGKGDPPAPVRVALERLSAHWDRIANMVRTGPINSQTASGRFWQEMPALLEYPAVSNSYRVAELQNQVAELQNQLAEKQEHIDKLNRLIGQIVNSTSWKVTSPLRFLGFRLKKHLPGKMLDLHQIAKQRMNRDPYPWAVIGNLFAPEDKAALAKSFPRDHFKLVSGRGGEKDYEYEARALIAMGAGAVSYAKYLSKPWQRLAQDFLSPEYREALSLLIGFDLAGALLEVSVFHYGPGGLLGPHCDLPDKIVTHVLYFNQSWNTEDGGCLTVLNSPNASDVVTTVAPIIGNSAVLVRSENSWHAVSPVADHIRESRRSLAATFYHPGSVSTLWPPDDLTPLHRFETD